MPGDGFCTLDKDVVKGMTLSDLSDLVQIRGYRMGVKQKHNFGRSASPVVQITKIRNSIERQKTSKT